MLYRARHPPILPSNYQTFEDYLAALEEVPRARRLTHTVAHVSRLASHLSLRPLTTTPHCCLRLSRPHQAWKRTWRRAYQLREEVLAGKSAEDGVATGGRGCLDAGCIGKRKKKVPLV